MVSAVNGLSLYERHVSFSGRQHAALRHAIVVLYRVLDAQGPTNWPVYLKARLTELAEKDSVGA
jgi:hypothetical protein